MKNDQDTMPEKTSSYKVVSRHRPSKMGKYIAAVFLLLVACFTAGLGGGLLGANLSPGFTNITRDSASDGNAVISQEEEDISAVASKVGPSVVSITTTEQRESFFGTQTREGAGTGIIISSDGYILTNKHVINGSSDLSVVTSDGNVHDNVQVLGTDPLNDLAFLKLDGITDLKPATLGDSSSIRIGQKVVAIGNSLGEFRNTVTSGIVSGTGRPVAAQEGSSVETLTDLIQTDAAINPGNSGGPLVNLSGQVIGINTAIAADAQSIGFAIPVNSAKGIIKNLEKTGKIERPFLGVNYVSITPEFAEQYNLPVKKGAYIAADNGQSVIDGSPADKAGIKDKDIITKVGDLEVGENGGVSSLISEYAVGEKVRLTIIRAGEEMTIDVTLEAYRQPANG